MGSDDYSFFPEEMNTYTSLMILLSIIYMVGSFYRVKCWATVTSFVPAIDKVPHQSA